MYQINRIFKRHTLIKINNVVKTLAQRARKYYTNDKSFHLGK